MNNELELSPEEIKLFDEFYQGRLAEVGAWDDTQELEIARDILAAVINDGLTPTADGGASYVRRGGVDWTDPATMQAAQATMGQDDAPRPGAGRGQKRGKAELWQGVGVLVLVLLVAAWFLWPSDEEDASAEGTAVEMTVEATEEIQPGEIEVIQTPVPTLEAELLADIVGGGVKTKELVVPRTLEIKGVSFIVQPVNTKQGDWRSPGDERAVSWIYGTVINYVLGLEATPDNKALLASLRPGDELLLRASTGRPVFRFAYADTVRVAPQASEIFHQKRPGLTLVLLNDDTDEARIIVRGIYLLDSEFKLVALAPVEETEPGEGVVLDDLVRVTCLGREVMLTEDTPAGYAYLGVNYVVEQVSGELPLVTAAFFHGLEVGGLAYPAVSVAEDVMPYPPLPETLALTQTFTTTLVYAVPEPVLQEEQFWEFGADPLGARVRVELPRYDGMLRPEVSVREAKWEGGLLMLAVEIKAGLRQVEVRPENVELRSGGTLQPVVNVFPWQVAPGEVETFSLVISPDGNGLVTVVVLEQERVAKFIAWESLGGELRVFNPAD